MAKGDFYPLYDKAIELNKDIADKFGGIYHDKSRGKLFIELETIRDFALFNYFSPVSIANYGLLEPGVRILFNYMKFSLILKFI